MNDSGDTIWRGIHFSRDTYFRWNFLFPCDSVARAGLREHEFGIEIISFIKLSKSPQPAHQSHPVWYPLETSN